MTKAEKIARALELRTLALTILKRRGTGNRPGRLSFFLRAGSVSISYRTPFQRMPDAGEQLKYLAAQLGEPSPRSLPYGLDIWAPGKVLNLEWDDGGEIVLVSFRSGDWEAKLEALAAG